jgi:MFS family permease
MARRDLVESLRALIDKEFVRFFYDAASVTSSTRTAQILGGWLSDRFDTRVVLAGGLTLWSIATGLTGLAQGFTTLLLLRVLLGLGECSPFHPASACWRSTHPSTRAEARTGFSRRVRHSDQRSERCWADY